MKACEIYIMTSTDLEEGLQYNKVYDVCLKRDCFQSTSTVYMRALNRVVSSRFAETRFA